MPFEEENSPINCVANDNNANSLNFTDNSITKEEEYCYAQKYDEKQNLMQRPSCSIVSTQPPVLLIKILFYFMFK